MAAYDAHYEVPHEELTPEQVLLRQTQAQVHDLQSANQNLGNHNINLLQQNQFLMGRQNQNFQNNHLPQQNPPPLAPRPNLNLPQPKAFTGIALELVTFKYKVTNFLRGNYNQYSDHQSQVMYAAGLMDGPAQEWLNTIIIPNLNCLPEHYTLELFLDELTAFFGGGITMASREHSLDDLRQTGSVSELAIAFQNIINTYVPRWTDSASIYVLSRKLKDAIRFELGKRGDMPVHL